MPAAAFGGVALSVGMAARMPGPPGAMGMVAPPKIRKEFPETWIWDKIENSGYVRFSNLWVIIPKTNEWEFHK